VLLQKEYKGSKRKLRKDSGGYGMGSFARDECFGLPNAGAIAGIVFGLLIVLFGLSWLFGWEINYMAYFAIVFGVLIVAGAVYRLTRKK